MTRFDLVIAQIHSLPPEAQSEVIAFIEQKHAATRVARLRALDETAGCLSGEDASNLDRSIREAYERIDDQ